MPHRKHEEQTLSLLETQHENAWDSVAQLVDLSSQNDRVSRFRQVIIGLKNKSPLHVPSVPKIQSISPQKKLNIVAPIMQEQDNKESSMHTNDLATSQVPPRNVLDSSYSEENNQVKLNLVALLKLPKRTKEASIMDEPSIWDLVDVSKSEVDELLEQQATLEKLLDAETILQEIKADNSKLIAQ